MLQRRSACSTKQWQPATHVAHEIHLNAKQQSNSARIFEATRRGLRLPLCIQVDSAWSIRPHDPAFASLLLLSMRCARFQLDCARLDGWSAAGGELLFATTVV